jgi:hypothetical protein
MLASGAAVADTTDTQIGNGIGTSIADIFGNGSNVAISTSVSSVTHSTPALVHKGGVNYYEVGGEISGTGWGGEWEDPDGPPVDAMVHYAYSLPFVLRWAADWDGTLVYYSHGRAPLGLLAFVDASIGAANEGRHLEREGDFVSDMMMAPARGRAHFAANLNGLKGDGGYSIRGLEPPFLGEPLKATIDVPLARDLVQVAGRLLVKFTGKSVQRTVGTGHSAGALVMQYLNGGLTDSPNSGIRTFTGGNYVVPYDPASGSLFQAFVPLAGGNFRINPAFPMSAPMLMVGGLAEFSAFDSVLYGWRLRNAGADIGTRLRTYQVRNLPHSWPEIVESTANANAFLEQAFGDKIHADGDRMQPVVTAVIDAAVALLKDGTPPPPSRIDGAGVDKYADVPGIDAIAFAQASGPDTSLLPSVFDPVLDQYVGEQFEVSIPGGFPASVGRYVTMLTALDHGPALSLPKVACRLAGMRISDRFSDVESIPMDFASLWKSPGEYTACLRRAVEDLQAQRLYATH